MFGRLQFDELSQHLAAVRDGSTAAVHDARVAIRRLREELSLVASRVGEDELSNVQQRLKRAARALSRLRDADVGQQLLESVTASISLPPALVGRLQEMLLREREVAWRKAIKTLENLKLHELPDRPLRAWPGSHRWKARRRAAFRRHLISRANKLQTAMSRAGGVYFPNRLHKVRLATKRLRYALELADRVDAPRPREVLGALKQAQEVLGEAHDREVFLSRLIEPRGHTSDDLANDLVRLEDVVRTDIRELHRQYLSLRPGLSAICETCSTPVRRGGRRTLVAAAIAVPSLVLLRMGTRHPAFSRAPQP